MKNKQTNQQVKKEKGFSLIELVIVIAIVAALSAIVLIQGGKMFGEGSKQGVIQDVAVAIPSAVGICSKIHRGNLTSCTKASLMRKAATLETTTACGDSWTLGTASDTEVELKYPLTSCGDADDIGNEVVEYVKELPRISTDTAKTKYTSGDKTLIITYLKK